MHFGKCSNMYLLGTLLMARSGLSTRTVRMADRLALWPSREYSITLQTQLQSDKGRERESNTTENTNNIIMLIMASTHIIIVHLTFNYTELQALLPLCSLVYITAPKHHKCDHSQVGRETQFGPTVLIVVSFLSSAL